MVFIYICLQNNHSNGLCRFLPNIERTSLEKRSASRTGSRLSNAVSEGSANQDTIGIALSKKKNKELNQCWSVSSNQYQMDQH